MNGPGHSPPGFYPQPGLTLPCPVCPNAGRDVGSGYYECVGPDEHEFLGGYCDDCGQLAIVHEGWQYCSCPGGQA